MSTTSGIDYIVEELQKPDCRSFTIPNTIDGTADAERIADAIRKNGKLESVKLQHTLNRNECKILFEALADLSSLRRLDIRYSTLYDAQAEPIANIIRSNPHLREVSLDDCGLTDIGLPTITKALAETKELRKFVISNNHIGIEGGWLLAGLLRSSPKLNVLAADDCDIFEEGIIDLAGAVGECSNLSSFSLLKNHCSSRANEKLAQALLTSGNSNLIHAAMPMPHQGVSAHVIANRALVNAAQDALVQYYDEAKDDKPATFRLTEMPSADLMNISRHLPAIEYFGHANAVSLFSDMLEAAKLAPDASITPEDLISPGVHGLSPLQHPDNWQQLDRITAAFQQQGKPLTREFLEQKASNGESYLQIGLTHAPHTVLPVLNNHGIFLNHSDLVDNRQPTALCKAMTSAGLLQSVFSHNNWQQSGAEAMLSTYRALPDEGKAQIGNLQALRASLEKDNNKGIAR